IWISFVAAGTRASHPEVVKISVPCFFYEASPVTIRVFSQEQVVALSGALRAAENAVEIDNRRPRRPGSESSPASPNQCGSHWGGCRNTLLRDHARTPIEHPRPGTEGGLGQRRVDIHCGYQPHVVALLAAAPGKMRAARPVVSCQPS